MEYEMKMFLKFFVRTQRLILFREISGPTFFKISFMYCTFLTLAVLIFILSGELSGSSAQNRKFLFTV